jgi:putative glutamine amidotransferase
MPRKPLIGIPTDRRLIGKHYFHMSGEKYLAAVTLGADAVPVLVPSLGPGIDFEVLLEACDGLLFTGNESNVEPHHYGGPASAPGTLHDPNRDATTLPLIPRAVAAGVPVLAICRGFQEMNVAYGGTLWQRPAHDVLLESGGRLRDLAGSPRLEVNSLHWQGVQKLGAGLAVEARSSDGLIEAFRVSDARSFAIGVQWHPEWRFSENPFSRALFAAFGDACRRSAERR